MYRKAKKDGIVKLDALLYGVVDPEHDLFLTGDFNSRTSNNDDFIPLEHTSIHDIHTVDTFNIPRHGVEEGNEQPNLAYRYYQCINPTPY